MPTFSALHPPVENGSYFLYITVVFSTSTVSSALSLLLSTCKLAINRLLYTAPSQHFNCNPFLNNMPPTYLPAGTHLTAPAPVQSASTQRHTAHVATLKGNLHALKACPQDGSGADASCTQLALEPLWERSMGGPVFSRPVVHAGGTVLCGAVTACVQGFTHQGEKVSATAQHIRASGYGQSVEGVGCKGWVVRSGLSSLPVCSRHHCGCSTANCESG
jgi:hypothetical protein